MPLYEYQCQSCLHRFELIRKFSDPPVTECPNCGGAVQKLISSPAIQFKGSGFYITDYARSGSGEKAESSKTSNADPAPAKTDASGSDAAKTDTSKADSKKSDAPAASAAPAATSTPKGD